MAFEDDMIEAGYSNEQDYLDRLMDDFEDSWNRQMENEMNYSDDEGPNNNEEEERERKELQMKREKGVQWVKEWKEKNPELSIIWEAYFRRISYFENIINMENRRFIGLNEHNELIKWLDERTRFESERVKDCWSSNFKKLFSMYENELFSHYFPENDELINMEMITRQARELSTFKLHNPSIWAYVISNYTVEGKLYDGIEQKAFWIMGYKREMDYEYWKENNIEQYNEFAKHWIANGNEEVYGEWAKQHTNKEKEWRESNKDFWERCKKNYEIREKNKFIENKINDYKYQEDEDLYFFEKKEDEYLDICFDDPFRLQFLPDVELSEESPFDISSLDNNVREFVENSFCSLDINSLSSKSAEYADRVLHNLWIYINRDDWEEEAIKKHYESLFRFSNQYSPEFLDWWMKHRPDEWDDFKKSILPIFLKDFEIVLNSATLLQI